jgi:hypothetical protein
MSASATIAAFSRLTILPANALEATLRDWFDIFISN